MKRYRIVYTEKAKEDIESLFYFIVNQYKTYRTAEKYVDGIENTILTLKSSPESLKIQETKSILQYGINARRINFKRMTIIYTVNGLVVYIQRVIASLLISDL